MSLFDALNHAFYLSKHIYHSSGRAGRLSEQNGEGDTSRQRQPSSDVQLGCSSYDCKGMARASMERGSDAEPTSSRPVHPQISRRVEHKTHSGPQQYSTLTTDEHRLLLNLCRRYTNAQNLSDREYTLLRRLQDRRLVDQSIYVDFVKSQLLPDLRVLYEHVDESIRQYWTDWVQIQRKQASLYPAHYKKYHTIPIHHNTAIVPRVMIHRALLHSEHAIPTLCLSDTIGCLKVPGDAKETLSRLQDGVGLPDTVRLAVNHGGVLCTEAAYLALTSTIGPSYEAEWEIPVRVEAVPGNQSTSVCIYIEDPIVPFSVTARDIHTHYYTRSFEAALSSTSGTDPHKHTLYNSWGIGELSLVIRSTVSGIVERPADPRMRSGATPNHTYQGIQGKVVNIAAKIEYIQSKFGEYRERVSDREVCRWWALSYICPSGTLLIPHITLRVPEDKERQGATPSSSPHSKANIIGIDEVHTSNLQQQMTTINPWCGFGLLYQVIHTCKTLSPGSYSVIHKTGSSEIYILQSVATTELGRNPPTATDGQSTLVSREASNQMSLDEMIGELSDTDEEEVLFIDDSTNASKMATQTQHEPVENKGNASCSSSSGPNTGDLHTLESCLQSPEPMNGSDHPIYDMHSSLSDRPIIQTKADIMFMPPICTPSPTQLPYTFPPKPITDCKAYFDHGKCAKQGIWWWDSHHRAQGMDNEGSDACPCVHTRTMAIPYCPVYAEQGQCETPNCAFPHMDQITLQQAISERHDLSQAISKQRGADGRQIGTGRDQNNPGDSPYSGKRKSNHTQPRPAKGRARRGGRKPAGKGKRTNHPKNKRQVREPGPISYDSILEEYATMKHS